MSLPMASPGYLRGRRPEVKPDKDINPDKDYYAVLGVLPDAEDIVIRAAYKALAQRYHPDRMAGPKAAANARMAGINEAYAVLSDAEKRKTYDKLRDARNGPGEEQFDGCEEEAPPVDDPLEKDWRIAVKFYPDLAQIEKRLSQFSWKLASTYRAYLLESREFEPRESLALLMEQHFLNTYFGSNAKNLDFARKLILARQRKAAQALNETIRVLGGSADPNRVIGQIARDFNIRHLAVDKEKIVALLPGARAATASTGVFTQMLGELGGTFASEGEDRPAARVSEGRPCKVEFDGKNFKFQSEQEFRSWFRRDVLPVAEQMLQ